MSLPFNYYRHMNLQALLVCSDERILRVLRRVMDELEIEVEPCADPTADKAASASYLRGCDR